MKIILSFYPTYLKRFPVFMSQPRGPLDYYIWSDRLFGISMEHPSPRIQFDEHSILLFDYGDPIGVQYNPAYISWWGLRNLKQYLLSNDRRFLDLFKQQVQWLFIHKKKWVEGIPVWTYDFDWQEGKTFLKAPWISAMSQGLAISCLIRAFRLERNQPLLETAYRASAIFALDIEKGGIRSIENGKVFYEEYPAYPLMKILDGFVFGLLGLYDLVEETQDPSIRHLFDEGIEGFISHLDHWNYRNVWTWYGNHGILSPPEYHQLNTVLTHVLYQIRPDPRLQFFCRAWNSDQKNLFQKMKTFLFLMLRRAVR